MKHEKLKSILAAHLVWLETEGRYGMRANLRDANLKVVNLVGANLYGADLTGAIK